MSEIILILPIFFPFLEIAGVAFPLLSTSLVLLAIFRNDSAPFLLAFLSGILFDFLSVSTIGKSSIVLLGIVFVVFAYKRRFQVNNLFFLLVATVLSAVVFTFITASTPIFSPAFGLKLLIVVTLASLFWRVLPREESHEAWS